MSFTPFVEGELATPHAFNSRLSQIFANSQAQIAAMIDEYLADGLFAGDYDIAISFEAWEEEEVVARVVAAKTYIYTPSASFARAASPASSSRSFDLRKNGVSIGSVTFGAGVTNGVFTGTTVQFDPGDVLTLVAPSTFDSMLTGVAITLKGAS